MNAKVRSTRRRFFSTAGAALAAPLAVAASGAAEASGEDGEALKARIAALEDVNAIRELNHAYASHVNRGAREAAAELFADPSQAALDPAVRRLRSDPFGEQDVIEIDADRQRATARIHCTVRLETPIEPRCPLVEMALQQGGGVVTQTESGVLENAYVKRGGVWKIERSVFLPT